MAPEMLLGKPFDEKADIYSFGIIMWQLLTREEPFSEFSELEPFIKAVAINNYRPPMPPGTNQKLSYLIHRCWHPQPNLRPSFTEIDNAYLQPIIVETAIPDEVGRVLWKNHFLNLDTVNWEQFAMAFYAILNLTLDVPSDAPLLDTALGGQPLDQALRQATLGRLEEYARTSAEAYARCVEEVKRRQGHSFYNLLKKLLGAPNTQIYQASLCLLCTCSGESAREGVRNHGAVWSVPGIVWPSLHAVANGNL